MSVISTGRKKLIEPKRRREKLARKLVHIGDFHDMMKQVVNSQV
jgi:hypothetical protein